MTDIRLLITLVGLLILPGCCTFKGWFGMLNYTVGVIAEENANYTGPTNILLVWPSPEKLAEVASLKDVDEAAKWVSTSEPQGMCRSADLGNFQPEDRFLIPGPKRENVDLVMQCGATHLFIFTTMDDPEPGEDGRIHKLNRQVALNNPADPGTGFLRITIKNNTIETEFLGSYDELRFYVGAPPR